MKTKLTLSIDKDLVEFARQQAQANRRSVSGMFSEFLLSRQEHIKKTSPPSVASMVGTLRHYPINDSPKAIRSAYAKKYTN
jgi:hypothetical protein